MEIKIIINEGEAGRMGRGARFMDRDSRRGRKFGRRGMGGPRHDGLRHGRSESRHGGEREWRRPGCRPARPEGEGMSGEGGRVIGKLVEMPDGRIRVVRRGEGKREHARHRDGLRHGQRHGRHLEQGVGARYNEEEREARRARRRLIRQIVRAIESGEFGEA